MAESFTKILDLVGRGGGPDSGFRTYLLTVVRRTVYDRSRVESRQVTTGEIELYDPGVPFVDPALVGLEKSLIARAYLSLPERWRAVLWHTEVERARPADVAPLLGLSANGVAALAYRAREGLRQAYLQMHLGSPPQHDCRPVLGQAGRVRAGRAGQARLQGGGRARQRVRGVPRGAAGADRRQPRAARHGRAADRGPALRRVRRGAGQAGSRGRGRRAAAAAPAAAGAEAAAGGGGRRHGGGGRRPLLASLLLVSDEKPVVRPPAITPVAQPPASVAPVPVPVPVPLPTQRPAQVPPPAKKDKPGKARLRATIDALGSLVRAQPGIVGIRLRNYGESATEELAAQVDLPDGVTLVPPARRGHSAALLAPVGTVDGWACRPVSGGARCAREPLQAGQGTAVFLRVLVADEAPQGAGPAVRIAAGSLRLQARAEEGVRTSGAPARFATDGKVAVRAVGNTLLSCPAERAGCSEARRRQGTQRDNDLWPMTALDQDERPDTTSSSGAELSLPKGSQVVWAGLYWSAADDEAGPIKLRPPGRRKYLTVQPGEVTMRELPLGPVYQAFADVSRLVGDVRRNGTWWAADIPMKAGVSRHAGWSLVLIVTDPAEPYSQAVVLDTATVVGGPMRRVRMPLGGLSPAASPARVELVTWEGDADLKGDKVSLGSGALAPGGGDRDPANVFDGSSNGVAGMTFGTDVDTVGAELGVDPGLTIVTDKDVVLFGVAALSVRARS
ncbi:hypothetical protein GCM10020220_109240 [Nonomuraea rubra]